MHRRFVVALVTACVTLLGSAGVAQAAPAVTNTSDSGPGSLRQAIAGAGAGETIAVPPGNYSLSSEPLTIDKNLTLAGHGSGDTIVRSTGPFRVFTIETTTPPNIINVTLSGLTIRDGRAFGGGGGGILAAWTNLTLREAVLTGNLASSNGEVPGNFGGVAEGGGLSAYGGEFRLIETRVTGNVAEAVGAAGGQGGSASGGGVIIRGGGLLLERSTVSGNVVNAGGGQGPSNPIQAGGVAEGGGISASLLKGGSLSIAESTISGNIAEAVAGPGGEAGEALGGGLTALTSTDGLRVTNTTIAGNAVRNGPSGEKRALGGGVFAFTEEPSGIPIGGGVPGTVTFTRDTIAGNRIEMSSPASSGANVFATGMPGSVAFGATIVANGSGPPGGENCGATGVSPLISQGFNLDSLDQCGFKSAGDKVSTNPLLSPLKVSGGPTATMLPATGSPVVDQGAAFPGFPVEGSSGNLVWPPVFDQRGVLRPIDLPTIPNSSVPGADGSDIGAVELQPVSGLTLGKLKKNKKKGTATLTVTLPQPSVGLLNLKGKGLKPQTLKIAGQGTARIKVVARGGVKKALARNGKRKVKLKVAYLPTGNTEVTKSRTTKLLKKVRKKHK